jgi:hypothetical protein
VTPVTAYAPVPSAAEPEKYHAVSRGEPVALNAGPHGSDDDTYVVPGGQTDTPLAPG